MLALPESQPAAARARRCAPRTCSGETLLLLEDGHCLRDQALAVCARSGVHEKQDFRATSIETLRQMVAAGAGVTLLPALASRGAYGARTRSGGAAVRHARCRAGGSVPCGARAAPAPRPSRPYAIRSRATAGCPRR